MPTSRRPSESTQSRWSWTLDVFAEHTKQTSGHGWPWGSPIRRPSGFGQGTLLTSALAICTCHADIACLWLPTDIQSLCRTLKRHKPVPLQQTVNSRSRLWNIKYHKLIFIRAGLPFQPSWWIHYATDWGAYIHTYIHTKPHITYHTVHTLHYITYHTLHTLQTLHTWITYITYITYIPYIDTLHTKQNKTKHTITLHNIT